MTISYTGDRCPYCQQPLAVATKVLGNIDRYVEPAIARAKCCDGGLVRVIPRVAYRIEKYIGPNTKDDWGE